MPKSQTHLSCRYVFFQPKLSQSSREEFFIIHIINNFVLLLDIECLTPSLISFAVTIIQPTSSAASSADEIMKFKELLDSGVITQEEFDAKKKEILGV